MSPKHLVVCSAENRYYHAWQAKAFAYSCLQHQGVAPLILVHGGHEDLEPGFLECEKAGALVVPTRNHRAYDKEEWAARNTVGALIDAGLIGEALGATHVVLMDPDMVWTRRINWPTELAVDRCDNDLMTGLAVTVAEEAGIDLGPNPNPTWGSRVPYVVPIEQVQPIANAWWVLMDRFAAHEGRNWSDQMRAWALALAALGAVPRKVVLTQTNWVAEAYPSAGLIHYAFEQPGWSKRWYVTAEDGDPFDPPRYPLETVAGQVNRELTRAGAFYRELAA